MIHETYIENMKLDVARAIKSYAEDNKMNQVDMAYLLQVGQPRVSKVFKEDVAGITLDRLLIWAYDLGITVTFQIN